jgi:hypothetical protein
MDERQNRIEEAATRFYEQIRNENPDIWYDVCQHVDLLAIRDHETRLPASDDLT